MGNLEELKTSAEWYKILPDIIVYDPDGWDRTNFEYSWNVEMISYKDYCKRLSISTCKFIRNGLDQLSLLMEATDGKA